MGITGQVGGAIARTLLAAGKPVRAVVRDTQKAAHWAAQGVELVVGDANDAASLKQAFDDSEGVFIMVPPYFAPKPGYPEARAAITAQLEAVLAARPGRIVALSSVGGHRMSGLGLITQVRMLEEALEPVRDIPVAVLRPAWFMENSLWDIAPARDTGIMPSFLQPLDALYPMVATDDIGRVASMVLQETWTGRRIIEIEGPRRYTQHVIAAMLGAAVGRSVTAKPIPNGEWLNYFQAQGTDWPKPRIEMLDGFNSGWIDFERNGTNERIIGEKTFEAVLAELIERTV
jgi:uncharacterized protein YbjT (DUF2867 family)